MGKDPDQAFLFCEAILDNLVADEKRLDRGFGDIGHVSILENIEGKSKTVLVAYSNTGLARNHRATVSVKVHLKGVPTITLHQPRMAGPPRMSRISPNNVGWEPIRQ